MFLVADKGCRDQAHLQVMDQPPTRRPDIHAASRVIANPGGYFEGYAIEVEPEDLVKAVQGTIDSRISWVKIIGDWPRRGIGAIPNFQEDALAMAVETAHAAGCRTAIHACAPETSSFAVAAGIDSIEHGLYLTAADVEALGARGGAWVPTIAAMEATVDQLGAESSGGKVFTAGLDNVRELLSSAPGAGITILGGTDLAVAHGDVAQEAPRLVEYGLTPEQAIHALTGAAYDYLGTERGFTAGQPADVVLYAGDPRDDVSLLGRPELIIRHGTVLGASQ